MRVLQNSRAAERYLGPEGTGKLVNPSLTPGFPIEVGPVVFGPHLNGLPTPETALEYPVSGIGLRLVNGAELAPGPVGVV